MVAGVYVDPWHGGCLRRIVKTNTGEYTIHGVYGNDDHVTMPSHVEYDSEGSEMTHRYWRATLRVEKTRGHRHTLTVDFSSKAGKKRVVYTAVYDENRRVIEWDDTNVWTQLYYNRRQLAFADGCHAGRIAVACRGGSR